jgi:predicted secreted protein
VNGVAVSAMGFSADGSQVRFGALHEETLEVTWNIVPAG